MRILNLIAISTVILLTGCGTYGEPLMLSSYYRAKDPCITTHYKGDSPEARASQVPSWCGGSRRGPGYVYDRDGVWRAYVNQK